MLKEKNKQKFICHPEVLSEGSIDSSHSFRMTQCETGRSMVEMLGVLAVIGVLSVAGIAGYSNAMNKHRANELLNEASKRAAIVAAQAMQGREILSISEFGTENTRLNFSETVDHDTANKQFTLTIEGVAEAVCQQMNNAKGPVIRKFEPATCSGDNNTVKLTYNDDMSATEKASDFNGDETGCEADSSRQYCASNDTCISATDTCPSTGPSCPSGSGDDPTTWTGASFTVSEGSDSITCYCPTGKGYDGTNCDNDCATSGNCSSNSTVCPGYYCSIAGGTTDNDVWCGTDNYHPGARTVEPLGTPGEPKTGYLSSPSYVASWDAAVNYCKALKSTIAQGVTVNGVNYGDYGSLSNGLASLPSGCSKGDFCSALDDGYYWLDELVQWDCDMNTESTTYGSTSCSALYLYYGLVISGRRGLSSNYALCE